MSHHRLHLVRFEAHEERGIKWGKHEIVEGYSSKQEAIGDIARILGTGLYESAEYLEPTEDKR